MITSFYRTSKTHLVYPSIVFVAFALMLAIPLKVYGKHPGENLDKELQSREKYFQSIDSPAPRATLVGPDGRSFSLTDLRERVVILHFIYTSCTDVCPLHTEKLADVQSLFRGTPMEDRVYFVSITTDPMRDRSKTLQAYGVTRGFERTNWIPLTTSSEQPEDTTRRLAKRFGHEFAIQSSGHQAHGVVTHVLDRGGRWAANFYGLSFDSINMVVYVNGLLNNSYAADDRHDSGWWHSVTEFLFGG